MKTLVKNIRYKLPMLQLMLLTGTAAFAQDSSGVSTSQTTVTHNTSAVADTPAMWYMSPWLWIAAGAVLLLLIVLVVRGNNGDSRQEVTRTTRVTTEGKND